MSKIQKFLLVLTISIGFFLRFYNISTNPPGLYWDEAVNGYDAYSILQTGKDHHGVNTPIFFESFGDWKLPVYIYTIVPFIKLFGLSEVAVRSPSVLAGTLSIFVLFLLVRHLTKNNNIALLSGFILAISPWHIQFSRAGYESTLALFLTLTATYLFLAQKGLLFYLSFFLFSLSTYTYHSTRIFAPLLLFMLLLLSRRKITLSPKKYVLGLLIFIIISIPIIAFSFSDRGLARARSESAFSYQEFDEARKDFNQKSKKPLRPLTKYVFRQPAYYFQKAAKAYLSHFSPTFLFLAGDSTGRHSQVDMGQVYLFDALLILSCLYGYKKLKIKPTSIFIAWLFLAPIPASIVTPTPHANRSLPMVIPLAVFSSIGLYCLLITFQKNKIILASILLLILYSFLTYTHLLFGHYPKKFAPDWQSGYKQMVEKVQQNQQSFENVYITNINSLPYVYVLFYTEYDPKQYQNNFGSDTDFGKYHFVKTSENVYDKGRILYVSPAQQKVDGKKIDEVNNSAGNNVFNIWEINGQN